MGGGGGGCPFFRPGPAGRGSLRLVVDTLYGHPSQACLASTEKAFHISDEVIDQALRRIYSRHFNPEADIEPGFFHAFAATINRAADKGFAQATTPNDDFRQAIRHSNDVFAAFKTHRLQNDVARQLLDSNGSLKPFEQWKNDVLPITSHQCGAWLRTEYDTAVLRARQAADWQQFRREKDVLPNLEWLPSTSPNPGADHMPFWGTILPVDHPFWDLHRPGDRWNCKCALRSTDAKTTAVPADNTRSHAPQPGLDENPATARRLFAASHPYIRNAYPGAREAVEKAVRRSENITEEFSRYDEKEWERSYRSEKAEGFVVTEKDRIKEAKKSKQAGNIYKKELAMCHVAADNGLRVEFLHGEKRQKGDSYDARLDDMPTDLKSTASHNNIAKYARYATREQGAKAVLFELTKRDKAMVDALREAKRKCPHTRILYYYSDEKVIREI